MARDLYELRGVGTSAHGAVAVKVGTYAHMVYAHHPYQVLQMLEGIHHRGLAALAQKTVVERHLRHAARACQGTQLVVGEVAGHVAEGAAVAVRADDGRGAAVDGVIERPFAAVAQVDHDALLVHTTYHLLATRG